MSFNGVEKIVGARKCEGTTMMIWVDMGLSIVRPVHLKLKAHIQSKRKSKKLT